MKIENLESINDLEGDAFVFNSVKYKDEPALKAVIETLIAAGFATKEPDTIYHFDNKTLFHFKDISFMNLPFWFSFAHDFCNATIVVNGYEQQICPNGFTSLTMLKRS